MVCWEKNPNRGADPGDSGVFEEAKVNGHATEETGSRLMSRLGKTKSVPAREELARLLAGVGGAELAFPRLPRRRNALQRTSIPSVRFGAEWKLQGLVTFCPEFSVRGSSWRLCKERPNTEAIHSTNKNKVI